MSKQPSVPSNTAGITSDNADELTSNCGSSCVNRLSNANIFGADTIGPRSWVAAAAAVAVVLGAIVAGSVSVICRFFLSMHR